MTNDEIEDPPSFLSSPNGPWVSIGIENSSDKKFHPVAIYSRSSDVDIVRFGHAKHMRTVKALSKELSTIWQFRPWPKFRNDPTMSGRYEVLQRSTTQLLELPWIEGRAGGPPTSRVTHFHNIWRARATQSRGYLST